MRQSVTFAVLIVLGSSLIAGAVVVRGIGRNTFGLAVQVFASGSSLALSYLLVVLYRGQQKLLERQLEIRERPELHVPPESVDWGELNMDFEVHNDGNSTARQLRVEQRIEVSRLGHIHNVFDDIMTPFEQFEKHEGYDDVSGWTSGRRFVKPGDNHSIRVNAASVEPASFTFENTKFRLLGISPKMERFDFSISWHLVYDYRGGHSDEVRVTSESYQAEDPEGAVRTLQEELPVTQQAHDDWTLHLVGVLCDAANMSFWDTTRFLYWMYIGSLPKEGADTMTAVEPQKHSNDKSNSSADSDDDE